MTSQGHRAWAEIDLGALRRNMGRVRERLGDRARILAVLKADAYGHGAVPVARALVDEPGLWGFGVGDSNEALELRAAGLTEPILILGTIIDDEVPQVVAHDVRVCIHSMDRIRNLEANARAQGRVAAVHLMVDTGMGRLGAQPPRAAELGRAIAASEWLHLEGVATHVSSSRPGHPFTDVQRERLAGLLDELREDGIEVPLVHFANTAALLGGVGCELALVRPGIGLYGMAESTRDALGTEPVMSLRSQIVYLKDVPGGTPVGYNGTYVTTRTTRVATLPIGYNDGLAYRLSNRGRVVVRGCLAPIVGAVSMDYTTVDVSHIADVGVGDVVTLIGEDGGRCLTMADLASLAGTIPYEIACSVGKRVTRVYLKPDRTGRGASVERPVRSPAAVAGGEGESGSASGARQGGGAAGAQAP